MLHYFDVLRRARDLAPHGYCLLWQPELIWTHVTADALIAAAYFSIPLALIHFVMKRKDLQFSWIFWLFAIFIVACGTTHIMSIWTLWSPDYGLEALIKVFTAIASVGTAIVLWPLIPKALALPSPLQLREANLQLSAHVRERDEALVQLQCEVEERRKAEAALLQAQKMDAVGQLTGGIAHDFNNLLTIIMGSLDAISRSKNDEKTRRFAVNAIEAAERGAKLTSQLLAFSRTQRPELKPVRVVRHIETMREILGNAIGPGVALALELTDDDVPVLADATQLELALLNLAINARDAMPDGGTLTISLQRCLIEGDHELPQGEYLELCVRDTGMGMEPEVAARAFEPFYTTKDVGQGTGLGLSMVYAVAKQSGGTARIDTQKGQGTCIRLILPRAQTEPGVQEAGAAPASVDDTDDLSILVIDDESGVRELLVESLRNVGHEVVAAQDGPEGLGLLESKSVDLIVLDYAMPGMNGAEVARTVRTKWPGQKILFVTGFADTAAIAAAAGNAPVLYKPFRETELSAAVQRAMQA